MNKVKTFLVVLALWGLSLNGALAQYVPVESIEYGEFTPLCHEDTIIYSCLMLGDVGYIRAWVEPWDATYPELYLESEDHTIATLTLIDDVTLVHAHSVGETKVFIRSLDPNYTDVITVKVVVKDIQQGDLKIEPPTLTILEGDYAYLEAVVEDPDFGTTYTYTNVTWSSSDETVITVDELNLLKSVSIGNAVVTATTPAGITATSNVTVNRKPPAAPKKPIISKITNDTFWSYGEYGCIGNCIRVALGAQIKIISNGEAYAIRYTLDGSDPTVSAAFTQVSASSGSQVITINQKTVIRAVALNQDPWFTVFSQELTYSFCPELKKPFAVYPSTYTGSGWQYGQQIELKEFNLIAGSEIRYTLDGSEPSQTSKLYTGPITLNETVVRDIPYGGGVGIAGPGIIHIRAKVFCVGFIESATFESKDRVRVNTPVIDPLTGDITCATPGAKIYYTLGDPPYGTTPNESSTLYTGPISNAGIINYKKLRAIAYLDKLNESWGASCDFYADSPAPVIYMWNYKTSKYSRAYLWHGGPTSFYDVAIEDKIQLVTEGYPSIIRFTDNGTQVTPTNGLEWVSGAEYGLYHNTTIRAKSYLPPRNESQEVTYNFVIHEKPERPIFSVEDVVVDPGTELCFKNPAGRVDGFVFTTDGTIPYIERVFDDGLVWADEEEYNYNGYYVYVSPHYYGGGIWGCDYYAGSNFKKITIDKTCTYTVVSFVQTLDGNVVMSDMSSRTYRVATQDVSTDIDKGNLSMSLPGPSDKTMGLAGKLLKLGLIKFESKWDQMGDISYLAICQRLKAETDPAKRNAFNTIKYSFSNDFKSVDKTLINSVIEPYRFSEGGGGFGFELETGGILIGDATGIVGGLYLSGKASAEGKSAFPLGPFTATCKIGLSAGVTAFQKTSLLTKGEGNKPYNTQSESVMEYWIDVKTYVGLGIPFLASLGFTGQATLEHKWYVNTNKHNMWLNGKFYATATLCGFSKDFDFVDGTWPIMSSKSDFSEFRLPVFTSRNGDADWKLLPRKYLEKKSVWVGDKPAVRKGAGIRVLQESIYSETHPKIAQAGGKRVMVFLADDPARDDYNRSVLMFSIFNSVTDTWSVPVAVNNNGKADYSPSIAANSIDIWVIWQKSNSLFDENSTVEDIVAAGEIAVARFNHGTNSFDAPSILTSNTFMDALPKILVSPGGPAYAAWIQNPESDMYGSNNLNKIMGAYFDGSRWDVSEVKTGLPPVYDLEVAWFDYKIQYAYITDGDNRNEDEFNLVITGQEGTDTQTIVENKPVLGLQFTALNSTKVLSWIEDDQLRYMTEGGSIQNLTDSTDMRIMKYKIISNGYKTAIVYPYLDKSVGVLYARNYESGKFGAQYKLAVTGGSADKFDGFFEGEDFYIVYNNSVKEDVGEDYEETNDLVTLKCPAPVNIRLTDLHYSREDVKLGQPLPVYLDIENIGGTDTDEIEIFVNGEWVTFYSTYLNTGDKKTYLFQLDVPSNMEPLTNFVISVTTQGTDIDMNDNFLSLTLGYTNFSMDLTTQFNDGNTVTVTADITNNSDYDANTRVLARIGSEDGQVIDYFDFENFEGRANKVKTFDYNLDDLCPAGEEIRLYYELISNKDAEYKCSSFVVLHNLNCSIPKDSLIVGIEPPIEMKPANSSISVYPNPTTGELRIENGELRIEKVDIFDISGKKVQSYEFKVQSYETQNLETRNSKSETVIDISHLVKGFYFLWVETEKGGVTAKVVKK